MSGKPGVWEKGNGGNRKFNFIFQKYTSKKNILKIVLAVLALTAVLAVFIFYKIKIAPKVPKSAVITKQVSGAITNHKTIKWAKIVKLSSLKKGQKYLQLPRAAYNINFTKVDKNQALSLLSNPQEKLVLSNQDRKVLAGIISSNLAVNSGVKSSGIPRVIFDVETAIVEAVSGEEPETQSVDISEFIEEEPSPKPTPESTTEETTPEEIKQEDKTEKEDVKEDSASKEDSKEQENKENKEESQTPGVWEEVVEEEPAVGGEEKDKEELGETAESEQEQPAQEPNSGAGGGGGGVGVEEVSTTDQQPSEETEALDEPQFEQPVESVAEELTQEEQIEELTQEEDLLLVEYETPPPTLQQELSGEGKTVVVSADSTKDVIEDLTVFVPLEEGLKVKSLTNIEVKSEDGKKVNIVGEDLDEDGYLDYVEWKETKLEGEKKFEMSIISQAVLLDSDGKLIENIYEKVAENDNVYALALGGQTIRLSFKNPLTSEKQIAFYGKSSNPDHSMSVKIYAKGSNKLLATINQVKDEKIYQADLKKLSELSKYEAPKIWGAKEVDAQTEGESIQPPESGEVNQETESEDQQAESDQEKTSAEEQTQGESTDIGHPEVDEQSAVKELTSEEYEAKQLEGIQEFDLVMSGDIKIDYFVDSAVSDVIESGQWILTPNGPRDMVHIKVGDEVVGYDFKTGEKVVNTITRIDTVIPETYGYWEIEEVTNVGRPESLDGQIEGQGEQDGQEETGEQRKEPSKKYVIPPFIYYLINGKYKVHKNQSIWIIDEKEGSKPRVVHGFEIAVGDSLYDDYQKTISVQTVEEVTTETQWTEFSVSGNHTYIADGLTVHNGSRYWVGGGSSANWNATGPTNWGSASNTQDDASVPTSSDDVFFDGVGTGASNSTLSAHITVRSVNFTGYANTLTHNSAVELAIGDGTAGAGNVALLMVSGMTYTKLSNNSSSIGFVSTSSTQQTITTGGKVLGNTVINAPGGSYILGDNFNFATPNVNFVLTAGSFDTGNYNITGGAFVSSNSNTRTLTLGSSTVTLSPSVTSWNTATTTGLTFNVGTSTIVINVSTLSTNFNGGGLTFNNLTLTGTTDTAAISFGSNTTISGTLAMNGNSSTNRLLVQSDSKGTARTLTAATVSASNLDLQDITGAGAGSWNLSAITGLSGDAGGNSGITFTTAQTNYWVGGTGNWSAVAEWASSSGGSGGTGRVPLPQDDAVFDANSFSAGSQTVTANMLRLGKNINWTGVTNTPTWTTGLAASIFGSLTLVSGMTLTTSTQTYTFEGRSSYTLTSAGKTWNKNITLNAPGGTLTLQDAFEVEYDKTFTVTNGTFDANNNNFKAGLFSSTNSNTRTILMGTGTWELTATTASTVWTTATATNLTLTPSTSIIKISGSTTNTRTFSGGGKTFGTLWFSNATAAGTLDIVGSNTFAGIRAGEEGNAQTIRFTAGTTTTISSAAGWAVSGAASNLITIGSITASGHTISVASGNVCSDYLSISRSTATGGATFYAGANSTNGGNNSGWLFEACVSNTAPSITAGPSDGGSYSGSPTNVGSSVTFTATATDTESDNYYLAICKTNSVTANNSAAPTCSGGNWAISSSTASGAQASVSYTAQSGDASSNDWYAFVCDHNAASACSSSSQGSGNNGSPFAVNHTPTFSAINNTSGYIKEGSNVTFTSTASDSDSDNVTLYVCKANDFTGSACGAGSQWCSSSAGSSNPSCSYTVQSGDGDGSHNYYASIIDAFGSSSSSNPRSSTFNTDVTVPAVNAGSDQIKKAQFTQDATTSDAASGIISYQWTKQSGTGNISFGSATLEDTTVSSDTDGSFVIRLTVADNAGNTNYDEFTLTWDTAVPTTTPDGNGYTFDTWTTNNVTVSLACSDGSGSGCSVTKYCTDVSNSCTPSTTYSSSVVISTGGTSYIRYFSTDNAGNNETTASQTLKINTVSSITAGPSDGGSYSGSPTNVGSSVTFTATATDTESDNYYLAICKTNSVTANNSAAPTCSGGNWAISSSTASGAQASVSYTAQSGDASSNDWYAFVCDHNAASACSSSSQGSGNNGSPFETNHTPSFSVISYSGSDFGLGANIEFTATASDTDSDTITFYLCKAADFTGTACGAAGEWCSSGAASSNPSCTYTVQTDDGNDSHNYFGYVIDSHNLESSSNSVSGSFTTQTEAVAAPSGGGNIISSGGYLPNIGQQIQEIVNQTASLPEKLIEIILPSPEIVLPPADQFVRRETPESMRGSWNLLLVEPLKEFVFSPLPESLARLTQKFPRFGLVLSELGIEKMTELEKLRNVKLSLPGINETIGLDQGSSIANITEQQMEDMPSGIVFVKVDGIDVGPLVSVNESGQVEQSLDIISGRNIELIIKPAYQAEFVKGYLTFISKELTSGPQIKGGLIPVASAQEEPETRLVLQEFFYQEDPQNPGIFRANVNATLDQGEYKIITEVNYKDKEIPKREIEMITVIDPEGYVYQRFGDGKLPIKNAKVSLYWLDTNIMQYQLWDAKKYSQQNPQMTDDRGNYSFLVPEGTYYIQVEAKGYLPYQSDQFQVREGRGVRFNIEVAPKYWWLKPMNWEAILLVLAVIVLLLNFFKGRFSRYFQRINFFRHKEVQV